MSPRLLDRAALGAAVAALLVLGLRPTYEREVDPRVIVVQTPGATSGDARSVAESLSAGTVGTLAAIDPLSLRGAELHLVGWGLDAAELDRPRLAWTALELPPPRAAGRRIEGDPATAARELVRLLREEAKVL